MSKQLTSPYMGKKSYGLFTNNRLEILTLYSFAFVGVLIKLLYNSKTDNIGNKGAASVTIWGFGLAAISLLCILFIHLGLINKDLIKQKPLNSGGKNGYLSSISYFFHESFSYVLFILILMTIMALNYRFYTKINIGNISLDYNRYSFMSTILILINLIVIYQYIRITIFKKHSGNHGDKKTIINSIIYLLSTINIIFIIIMYILLQYYSTDG